MKRHALLTAVALILIFLALPARCGEASYDELLITCYLPPGGAPARIDVIPTGFLKKTGGK